MYGKTEKNLKKGIMTDKPSVAVPVPEKVKQSDLLLTGKERIYMWGKRHL